MTDQTSHDATSDAAPFAHAGRRRKGYDPAAVDEFLAKARHAFEADENADVAASDIRTVAFPLVKRGYQVAAVDAALTRVEDAFAARERERALSLAGARAWVGSSRKLAQEVLDRLSRPNGRRFARVGPLRYGYRIDEVDIVADRLARFLETGEDVTVDQVRTVAFRMQRRGYSEAQVDAVLDAVVEVMLAVV